MKRKLSAECFAFSLFAIMLIAGLFYGCGSSKVGDGNSLTGTEWVLYEMNGNKYEPAGSKDISLKFDEVGLRISGKAPCNTYASDYIIKDTKLTFGLMLSTEMACGELETEYVYLKLLPKVFAYQISGDKLYFFDLAGIAIFRYRAVNRKAN